MPNQTCRTVLLIGVVALAGIAIDDNWADELADQVTAETPQLSPLATSGPKPPAITPPPAEAIDAMLERGVDFLLKRQNPNGSWGSARRTN